jgi:hypothetical protein
MGPVAIGAESDQIEDVAPRTLHAMANPSGHLMTTSASVLPSNGEECMIFEQSHETKRIRRDSTIFGNGPTCLSRGVQSERLLPSRVRASNL